MLFHFKFLGPSDYEMIAKLKIFYLKLELINEKYFKDYKDNPSQQFRKLSSEIENEVKFCLDITEMSFLNYFDLKFGFQEDA